MNIFILDLNQEQNVKYYVDKHVVKMPLETCQMLSTVYSFTNQAELAPYKINHANHPCSKWTRESLSNWLWLRNLGLEICKEYTYRYDKHHKCEQIMRDMVTPNIIDIGLTNFSEAMPEQYRCDDAIKAYRDYYNGDKKHLFKWKKRAVPEWITA